MVIGRLALLEKQLHLFIPVIQHFKAPTTGISDL